MNLQERLTSLSEFNIGIKIIDGSYIINILYPENWTVINSEDEKIQLYQDDNNQNVYYYVTSITTDIEDLFKLIDETLNYNRELEEKAELFAIKIKELQDLFVNETIEDLKKLEFVIKTTKRGRKPSNNKKNDTIVEEKKEEAIETIVEETTEGNIDDKIDKLLASA